MTREIQKTYILFAVAVVVLGILACGSVQVGVVTPTSEQAIQSLNENQAPEAEQGALDEVESPTETPTEPGQETPEPPITIAVTAWLGHIASLPEGSQFDDMVVLSPEGTGEFGLTGATPEIEAEIRALCDAEGPHEYAHLWGALSCGVDDYNNCQLLVDRLQYGTAYSEETIIDWVGTMHAYTFNDGDSTVLELRGDYPMWYSIHASQDPNLQAQIKNLRDTGAVVKVSGQLLVGIPDVNGTRIEISSLEVIEAGAESQPEYGIDLDVSADWPVFVDERYGYQIKYPMEASISLFGPESFFMEDLPEGMTPEQYIDSLLKEYTDRLCVRIDYSLGWITISAPPNQEKYLTPCGPTGVGAGELITKIQSVYVGDQLYQANGHEIRLQVDDGSGGILMGETLDLHSEMYGIKLEDGTNIRFGSTPRHDATFEDYMMKTRETLLQILATYEVVP